MTTAVEVTQSVDRLGGFRLVVSRGDDALALLDDRWDDLVSRQPLPNPLLSATWLRALARWETGTPLVVVAEAGETLVAGAALELRGGGGLRPTVAFWLGPFEQLISPDMLADPAWPDAPAAVLRAALEHADVLRLERVPAHGAAATAAAATLPWRRVHETGVRWVAPCPSPSLDRLRRRLATETARAEQAGATVTVRVVDGPDEVEAALAWAFRVHRDRWRDRPGEEPRFATTQAHRSWNARVIGEMAALGRVRLAEVLEDGRPVAFDLGLLYGRGAVGHTTAMRPTRALAHPGLLASLTCADALAEAGATRLDIGLGGGGPGTAKDRFGPVGETVHVIVAARSAARQHRLDAVARLRGAAARVGPGIRSGS